MFDELQKPTYVKFAQDTDFYTLFKKINAHVDTCFLLESLGPQSSLSRYSIIGFSPQSIIQGEKNALIVDNAPISTTNPYHTLSTLIGQNNISRAYAGGLIGYLGFDALNFFESSVMVRAHKLFPQFLFGFYTDGLIFDKMTGEIFYFYYIKNKIKEVRSMYSSTLKTKKPIVETMGDSKTKKEHKRMVQEAKNEIAEGNSFQCVLGFKTEYKITGNPIELYTGLRKINPSPHMYFIKFGDIKIIGASPELLFRMQSREMETYPLAGTARRGKDGKEDIQLARALLSNEKEVAEHNMLIDLHRNDIGRVAKFGTVKVRRCLDIKKFSHVQHISSEIAGICDKKHDMFSALASNFPAGTLSGAPKIESVKIIDRLEGEPRGPYGGALGHFGLNGDCTFAIPIRTLFIKGEYAYQQNGSGIVYDSNASEEYSEVKRKAKAMDKVLDNFTQRNLKSSYT